MSNALVIGGSAAVWAEVRAAMELCHFDKFYCVKLAGIHWPQGNFTWVTLHPEFMDTYEAQRRALGHPAGYEIVAPLKCEVGMHAEKGRIDRRVSYRWPNMVGSASSGIFGAKVALGDGMERVVLAGIPMEPTAGHFLPESRNGQGMVRGDYWKQHEAFVKGFEISVPHLIGKVKSMSGRTREILGAPSAEWLAPQSEKPVGVWADAPLG